jgi:hypothetical protein
MALTVQAAQQPNQKNNRQRNPDKPKQQSASHNWYSYFVLHKLNATTISQLNRSDGIIALLVLLACCFAAVLQNDRS